MLAQRITANCPTALDNEDDTNDSAADFDSVTGFPVRNNSVAPTETVCPPTPSSTTTTTTKRCKKKNHRSVEVAKKKKCKKKKKR